MISISDLFVQTPPPEAIDASADLHVPIGFLDDLNLAMTRADILGIYSVWSQHLVKADRCSIALRDDDETLLVTAMNGSKGIPGGTRQPIENTVVGSVYKHRKMLYLPDISDVDLPDAERVHELGYRSAVIAPIVTGRHCFGALSASFKGPIATPGKLVAMLRAMARCLSTQLLVIEQMESLHHLARTDALTGACNRHYLSEYGTQLWRDWQNSKTEFSFVAIDVDHFKQINDTHGHDVGDDVLCMIVQRLMHRSRNTDNIIRLGGEEFGILFADANVSATFPRCERLKRAICNRPIALQHATLNVTASIGLTQVYPSDAAFGDVLVRADRALYRAKANGRNQIVVAKEHDMFCQTAADLSESHPAPDSANQCTYPRQ